MPTETVLITGASSGIGLELAREFAADKSNLVLVARSREKLESLSQELRTRHNVEVVVLPKDLAEAAAPQEILAVTPPVSGPIIRPSPSSPEKVPPR